MTTEGCELLAHHQTKRAWPRWKRVEASVKVEMEGLVVAFSV